VYDFAAQVLSMRLAANLLVACLLIAGCGGKGTYPVEGKVVYPDGTVANELAGYIVSFESAEQKVSASGLVHSDGTFRVGTFDVEDGAVPGKYKIAVTPPQPSADDPPPLRVIDPKYSDLDSSGLEVTIEPKTNVVILKVERAKR
jgi:hypothetical protein